MKSGVVLGIVTFLAVFWVAFGMFSLSDAVNCWAFSNATGYETKWRLTCYAKVDNKWVPKQYVFGNAHELRIKEK